MGDSFRYDVRSSERVYQGKIISVRVDEVTMPGGGTAKREVAEHPGAVAIVAIEDAPHAGKAESADELIVVLIEQYRHPLRRKLWELPAGLLDVEQELPLPAAQRELAEETGLAADDWSVLVDLASSPGFSDETVRIFLARGVTDVGREGEAADEEADMRMVRVSLAAAVDAVLDGRIVNASAVAGLLAARCALTDSRSLRRGDESSTSGQAVVHTGADTPAAPPFSFLRP